MAAGFKQATVNAASVPATQTNFPSYVDLSRIGITTLAEAQSVRVYADSGKTTEWAREIVSVSQMWVKVPSLTSTVTIYVDWDGVRADYAVTDTYGRNNVWTGYTGVWHLDDSSGAAATSSTGSNNLNDNGTVGSGAGQIQNGRSFDGVNDFLQATGNLIDPTTFTVLLWTKRSVEISSGQQNMTSGSNTTTDRAYDIAYDFNGGTRRINYRMLFKGVAFYATTHTVTLGTTNNHFICMKHASSLITGYYNGASTGTIATSGSPSGLVNAAITIGAYFDTDSGAESEYYNGIIDEVQLTTTALSDNWITTSYNNQNAESTFWGTWTTVGGGGNTTNFFHLMTA